MSPGRRSPAGTPSARAGCAAAVSPSVSFRAGRSSKSEASDRTSNAGAASASANGSNIAAVTGRRRGAAAPEVGDGDGSAGAVPNPAPASSTRTSVAASAFGRRPRGRLAGASSSPAEPDGLGITPAVFRIWSIRVSFFARPLGFMPRAEAMVASSSRSLRSRTDRSRVSAICVPPRASARLEIPFAQKRRGWEVAVGVKVAPPTANGGYKQDTHVQRRDRMRGVIGQKEPGVTARPSGRTT